MEDKTCSACKYFLQHYIQKDDHYQWTSAGHCAPRIRDRKPSAPACKYYEERETQ